MPENESRKQKRIKMEEILREKGGKKNQERKKVWKEVKEKKKQDASGKKRFDVDMKCVYKKSQHKILTEILILKI